MKKLILFLVLEFFILLNFCFSQLSTSDPVRLTNGNNDRNPSFKSNANNFETILGWDWEFMAFERVSGTSSNICVGKIDYYGSSDSAVYLTNDSYRNTNPDISYNGFYYSFGQTPKYALVVWESNKLGFGRSCILGSRYIRNSGWSAPFVIDTSFSNNIKPKVNSFDSTTFLIVYESSERIKYKKYDILTNSFPYEVTLTDEPNHSPFVTSFRAGLNNYKVVVSYEKELSLPHRAIYFREGLPDSIPLTENPGDTIAYAGGSNLNQGFQSLSFIKYNLFLANRNGNFNLYGTTLSGTNITQVPLILNSSYFIFNYVGVDYPITDNSGAFLNYFYGYNRRTAGLTQVVIRNSPFSSSGDSLIYDISTNSNYETKNAISTGILLSNSPNQRYWIAFNKDSTDSNYPSRIFGINFNNSLTKVSSNSPGNLNSFSLSQNYPNPFNPSTIINYKLPITNYVSLKVFNALGKEVATLVNEKQNAGSYNYQFSTVNYQLSSGMYFYKLTAGDFSEVKKMILLK